MADKECKRCGYNHEIAWYHTWSEWMCADCANKLLIALTEDLYEVYET